jgi:hypothetical protein
MYGVRFGSIIPCRPTADRVGIVLDIPREIAARKYWVMASDLVCIACS